MTAKAIGSQLLFSFGSLRMWVILFSHRKKNDCKGKKKQFKDKKVSCFCLVILLFDIKKYICIAVITCPTKATAS